MDQEENTSKSPSKANERESRSTLSSRTSLDERDNSPPRKQRKKRHRSPSTSKDTPSSEKENDNSSHSSSYKQEINTNTNSETSNKGSKLETKVLPDTLGKDEDPGQTARKKSNFVTDEDPGRIDKKKSKVIKSRPSRLSSGSDKKENSKSKANVSSDKGKDKRESKVSLSSSKKQNNNALFSINEEHSDVDKKPKIKNKVDEDKDKDKSKSSLSSDSIKSTISSLSAKNSKKHKKSPDERSKSPKVNKKDKVKSNTSLSSVGSNKSIFSVKSLKEDKKKKSKSKSSEVNKKMSEMEKKSSHVKDKQSKKDVIQESENQGYTMDIPIHLNLKVDTTQLKESSSSGKITLGNLNKTDSGSLTFNMSLPTKTRHGQMKENPGNSFISEKSDKNIVSSGYDANLSFKSNYSGGYANLNNMSPAGTYKPNAGNSYEFSKFRHWPDLYTKSGSPRPDPISPSSHTRHESYPSRTSYVETSLIGSKMWLNCDGKYCRNKKHAISPEQIVHSDDALSVYQGKRHRNYNTDTNFNMPDIGMDWYSSDGSMKMSTKVKRRFSELPEVTYPPPVRTHQFTSSYNVCQKCGVSELKTCSACGVRTFRMITDPPENVDNEITILNGYCFGNGPPVGYFEGLAVQAEEVLDLNRSRSSRYTSQSNAADSRSPSPYLSTPSPRRSRAPRPVHGKYRTGEELWQDTGFPLYDRSINSSPCNQLADYIDRRGEVIY